MTVVLPLLPRWVRWLGVVTVAGFLFYTSVVTVPPEVSVQQGGQDVFRSLADITGFAQAQWRHFLAYGALSCALAYATDHWETAPWSRALVVIALAALYGLGIELIQPFAQRTFDVRDIAANTLGATLVLPWFLLRQSIELRPLRELI
jgi:VanZ family protein